MYRTLLEEILEGDLKDLRLHQRDFMAMLDKFSLKSMHHYIPFMRDDEGLFVNFNGCRIRPNCDVPSRGWK